MGTIGSISPLTPRPYQERTIKAVKRCVRDGVRSVLIVSPTGSGKTAMGSILVRDTYARSNQALWLAHRKELIDQTVDSLDRVGVSHISVLRGTDDRVDPTAPIVLATPQTLAARSDRPKAAVVIFDEARHYCAAEWNLIAQDYANAVRVGLDATPSRTDGTALGDMWSALVVAAQYSELIRLGHILECDVVAPHERQVGSLAAAPWDAYDQQVATLPDSDQRHTVIFCSTVLQALECTQRIPDCRVVHGVMPERERTEILAAFAAGEIPTIANCMVLTEGWDAPICDTAILARSCTSPSTYMQIAGRILRPNPADPRKSPLLIDLVGAIHEHGHPCEDREYSLTGRPISTSAQACVIWQCRGCGLCLPRPPSDRTCPRCQHVAPARECKVTPRHLEHIRWTCSECGQMGRVTPLVCPQCGAETSRAKRVASETDDKRHAYLVKLARDVAERGYKVGWMLFRYEAKYGERPSWDEVRRAQEEVGNAA